MVEPDKIRGYVGAHDQLQKPKEDVNDPEKFKKVLKVEESTESEKREQRKKKRSEHEGETEEEADVGPKAPDAPQAETAFTEVLQDKPDKDDLLTGQTGSARRAAPTGTNADLGYDDEKGQGLRKTVYSTPQEPGFGEEAPPAPEESEEPPPFPSSAPPNQEPPPPPQSTQQAPPPPSASQQEEQTPQQGSSDNLGPPTTGDESEVGPTLEERRKAHSQEKEAETKAKAEMSGLPEEKKRVETFKEKKLREKYERLEEAHKKQVEAKKHAEQAPKEAEVPSSKKQVEKPEEKAPTKEEPLKEQPSEPKKHPAQQAAQPPLAQGEKAPPQEVQQERVQQEGTQTPLAPAGATDEIQKRPTLRGKKEGIQAAHEVSEPLSKKAKGKEQEGGAGDERREKGDDTESILDEIAATYRPETISHFAPVETEETPESKLNPRVHELYEKMVGFITIQKIDGVERTTVTIDLKGSVFDGAELVLDRSETAQDTFNVELRASPEAVALFNQNVSDLVAAFQKKEYDFRVNVKRASIHKRYAVQKGKGSSSS